MPPSGRAGVRISKGHLLTLAASLQTARPQGPIRGDVPGPRSGMGLGRREEGMPAGLRRDEPPDHRARWNKRAGLQRADTAGFHLHEASEGDES